MYIEKNISTFLKSEQTANQKFTIPEQIGVLLYNITTPKQQWTTWLNISKPIKTGNNYHLKKNKPNKPTSSNYINPISSKIGMLGSFKH